MTRAVISRKTARLSEDFGLQLAMRKLNLTEADLEKQVGRFVRGKRKGQLRGAIEWFKVERGGWVKFSPEYMDGEVATPGLRFGYKVITDLSESTPYNRAYEEHCLTLAGQRMRELEAERAKTHDPENCSFRFHGCELCKPDRELNSKLIDQIFEEHPEWGPVQVLNELAKRKKEIA